MIKITSSIEELNEWDQLVLNHQNGSIFQSSIWLSNFEGKTTLIYSRDESDQIVGGFLFNEKKKYGLKRVTIPPYTPIYAPFWSSNLTTIKSLKEYRSFIEEVDSRINSRIIDMIHYTDQIDFLPFKWNDYLIRPGLTFQVKSNNYGIEDIHKSKRRYLKKLFVLLEKNNIELIENACPNKILSLQKKLAKKRGFNSNIQLLEKVLNNQEIFKRSHMMAIATSDGEYIAACFAPYDSNRSYHLINANTLQSDPLLSKVNILLTYLLVKRVTDSGKIMDFEGSSLKGVEEFYRQMGGVPKPRFRLTNLKFPIVSRLITFLS